MRPGPIGGLELGGRRRRGRAARPVEGQCEGGRESARGRGARRGGRAGRARSQQSAEAPAPAPARAQPSALLAATGPPSPTPAGRHSWPGYLLLIPQASDQRTSSRKPFQS
uniref:LBH domain-containing protein 2 isoform X2 n=1 Tax=Macaca mulatta TaxID=9544 RepID=UPI0010A2012F|nr:LBH domain-containing protein 2 isoform X2 [Macaca mulatta]